MSVVELYYLETLKLVETADIDILAHMGLFRRGMAMAGHDTHFSELKLFPEIIRRILNTIMDRGIVLELNTSGLRRHERSTYPVPEIAVLYRNIGGTLVTLGSDTHRDRHRFYGLKEGRNILQSAGFSEACVFRRRDPQAMSLD